MENQFIKLTLQNENICHVNSRNITHITKFGEKSQVYVIGQIEAIVVKESAEEILDQLPSKLGYENI